MPGALEYVELHCHSAFSFLDGASLPEDLALAAKQRGYRALALTDHDGVYGSMEFAQAAREHEHFRAIHGAEITVRIDPGGPVLRPVDSEPDPETRRHLTLLVKNAVGWRNLCRLLTLAHEHTRDHPRRVRTAPWVTIADVCDLHEGLVCLSGCADHGVEEEATLKALRDAFGTEDLYVELQRRYLRGDREQGRRRTALARQLRLRCVATGNIHAHTRERALLQDALVAVRRHTTLDGSEPFRRGNHSHVLASPAAMAARLADYPEAVAETVRLAERLEFDLTEDLGYSYPGEDQSDAGWRLAGVCAAAFDERYPVGNDRRREAEERLDQELTLIERFGLSGFFVLHHEILELAREVAHEVRGRSAARAVLPPGRGRGSSVSSVVCYLTGLSHIDPIEAKLSLGRFLNDGMKGVPDIDLDFPRDIRAALIPRIHETYGTDRAALVAAFPTYRARGAVRELGAALGLPAAELERVARGSEGWSGHNVASDIAMALGTDGSGSTTVSRWEWLARLSGLAHGLPRHLSQHSGGMVVATRPLIDCCPVVPAAMEGRQMVMWDKDSCADAKFLKIDLLGLGMLSSVERCVELISKRRGEEVDLSRIDLEDEATFASIQRAETTGVFQIESRAQMGSLLRTKPESIADLTVQVALVRPGPIQGGAVNPYIERRQRMREDPSYVPSYLHPSLEGVLKDTLGTIIFQDQVIEVAMAFAKFSSGQAEGLRRAMSRKRSQDALNAYHRDFVEGAQRAYPDVTVPQAEQVWQMIQGFAGFGFPKAHGAAFGLLAYQSAWLREYYGPEYVCSLLDEQPMGFYPPDALIHEAQRRRIPVIPPDVAVSQVDCTVTDGGAIRIGLGYVKGVQPDEAAALVAERERHGPWRDLEDLVRRTSGGATSLEALAWSGACDALVGEDVPVARRRRAALWRVGAIVPGRRVAAGTQMALGLESSGDATAALPGMNAWERLIADYETTATTTATHPMELLRPQLGPHGVLTSGDLPETRHGATVRVGGLVLARQRPGSAKGVVFLLLEDERGTINLVLSPPVYERFRLAARTEPLVVVEGRLERHPRGGGQINVVVRWLRPLDDLVSPAAQVAAARLPLRTPVDAGSGVFEQDAIAAGGGSGGFRRVAPGAMNFGRGRR